MARPSGGAKSPFAVYIELITRIRKKPNSNISRSKHKRIGRLFKNIPAFPKSFIR